MAAGCFAADTFCPSLRDFVSIPMYRSAWNSFISRARFEVEELRLWSRVASSIPGRGTRGCGLLKSLCKLDFVLNLWQGVQIQTLTLSAGQQVDF